MYYGELATRSPEYQWGHEKGSIRAYDDAIMLFERLLANEKKGAKHTTSEVISMLQARKIQWLKHCEEYGMAKDPEEEEEDT